jgi:apolipoprotein N-acyltransferase
MPLFLALRKSSLTESFGYGWLTGFVAFISPLFWLSTFHSTVPIVISAILALYLGLFGLLFSFIRSRTAISYILIIPIIWVSIELLRSIGPWGFPAGLLGYSQYKNLLLIQFADIAGVYGVSFLIALVNAGIYSLFTGFSKVRAAKVICSLLLILLAISVYGAISFSREIPKTSLRIASVQPNLQFSAIDPYTIEMATGVLGDLTGRAAGEKPDLIIWPETVIRESLRIDPFAQSKIKGIVGRHGRYLLLGNPDVRTIAGRVRHFNSAFLISPDGAVLGQYDKIRPVPFWEVLPIRHLFGFFRNVEAKGEFDEGRDLSVFRTPKGRFGALICYEGIFPDISRKLVKNGAQFLVNISNDGWSQSWAEHYQHASMNVFRAVENRVYYVRVGNSGVTEVISPRGEVINSLPIYRRGYLVEDIGLSGGKTFYTRYGDVFGWLNVALAIGMVLLFSLRRKTA